MQTRANVSGCHEGWCAGNAVCDGCLPSIRAAEFRAELPKSIHGRFSWSRCGIREATRTPSAVHVPRLTSGCKPMPVTTELLGVHLAMPDLPQADMCFLTVVWLHAAMSRKACWRANLAGVAVTLSKLMERVTDVKCS